eukprot:SAG31_NODE_820_length_11808_cov_16.331540_3_plen_47_part_00
MNDVCNVTVVQDLNSPPDELLAPTLAGSTAPVLPALPACVCRLPPY